MMFFFLFTLVAITTVSSLNVHLVCHSHDDVGWLSTVDQYYTEQVQYIIDSVISALQENPDRKFIYVEQAFFQRWWHTQTDQRQEVVRQLVKSGQLEFINGGWCMHDEAATHFVDMIDQTTLGHQFLLNEFGVVPKTGWQIDPFGHSATQAALLTSEVGFQGLFFARIDAADNTNRRANKALEFIWRASPSFGASAQVFAGAFASGSYGPPPGLCWDINCWLDSPHPIQDDPSLEDYNVPERVETAVRTARDFQSLHLGDDVMFTLGNDFEYRAANEWFKNLDKLIKYVNADGRIKMFYSTPTQYLQAKLQSNVSWPLKTDDLFPYSDGPHSYWTGFYTSRPALKRYVRINSALLQTARQIEAWVGGNGNDTALLWDALSTTQHHDAVTGTEVQWVAYDYALRLAQGAVQAADTVHSALAKITTKAGGASPPFTYCPLANVSICPPSQSLNNNNTVLVVLVYNALAHSRSELIHIPVSSPAYCNVRSTTGPVPVQLALVMHTEALNMSIAAPYRCSFLAKDLPPVGYSTYWLSNQSATVPSHATTTKKENDVVTIENEFWNLQFDTTTGLLSTATHIPTNTTTAISQEYLHYLSGNDSNPYVFRPLEQTPRPIASGPVRLEVVNGVLYAEVRQYVADWMSGSVRLVRGSPVIEFDYTVGPIPIADDIGKEIITRFNTSIHSQDIFYTDSNGREFQQRKRDYRPTWNYTVTEPVSGNYYPMTTAVFIQDPQKSLAILTDRAQGVSSMADGSIEICLHRRVLGGWIPLNEPGDDGRGLVISGRHSVLLSPPESQASAAIRALQSQVYLPVHVELAPVTVSVDDYITTHKIQDSFLKSSLPDNVDLITMAVHDNDSNTLLIRLAHLFSVNDQSDLARPVTVDLSQLFKDNLVSVKEVSLTANQPIQNVRKIQQQLSEKTPETMNSPVQRGSLDGTVVTITPMEIRTFIIVLE